MIPESYHEEKNKCQDCKHCFIVSHYEEADQHYCHFDKSKRPICGELSMDESYDFETRGAFEKQNTAWEKWANDHAINGTGTCNEWRKAK